ncbi:uncharacterized protein I303_103165 [Kwoniella dejecticola CBS 10117]|uniref:Uncharacterized protein n=1 Tax=Kwoniella dejecticola CBS 10117 TaxID=1296121 RepID=A0A1A6AAR9_9TREE|nr:uncharacterized protein I303_03186 [Kwoniella dejecticola CBS 10117]OBR87162.1 hypothetical protein I303_03186 [Kwoniella dejecticola CBS 10117]
MATASLVRVLTRESIDTQRALAPIVGTKDYDQHQAEDHDAPELENEESQIEQDEHEGDQHTENTEDEDDGTNQEEEIKSDDDDDTSSTYCPGCEQQIFLGRYYLPEGMTNADFEVGEAVQDPDASSDFVVPSDQEDEPELEPEAQPNQADDVEEEAQHNFEEDHKSEDDGEAQQGDDSVEDEEAYAVAGISYVCIETG